MHQVLDVLEASGFALPMSLDHPELPKLLQVGRLCKECIAYLQPRITFGPHYGPSRTLAAHLFLRMQEADVWDGVHKQPQEQLRLAPFAASGVTWASTGTEPCFELRPLPQGGGKATHAHCNASLLIFEIAKSTSTKHLACLCSCLTHMQTSVLTPAVF